MTRKTLVALTALALSLALSLVACSSGDEDSGAGEVSAGGETGAAVEDSRATLDATSAEFAPDGRAGDEEGTPAANAAALPGVGPRIIQTASLRLVVARGGFDQAVEEARSIAAGLGGFVVSSSESRDPGAKITTGTLVLRVPGPAYADAMRRLGDVGRVAGREESGRDVSAEFVDLEARKRHLEAVETQLLKLLQRAGNVAAALSVQAKLNDVQLQLEQVRGRLRYLDDQTAFATISMSVREQLPDAVPGRDDGGILDAWADGARAFGKVAAGTFVVLATIAPVLLLLAFVALAVRIALRRGLVPRRRVTDRA
jgi:Domain of unknown function (DUF4349)